MNTEDTEMPEDRALNEARSKQDPVPNKSCTALNICLLQLCRLQLFAAELH